MKTVISNIFINKVDKERLCAIVNIVRINVTITIDMIKFCLLVVTSYLVMFVLTSDQEAVLSVSTVQNDSITRTSTETLIFPALLCEGLSTAYSMGLDNGLRNHEREFNVRNQMKISSPHPTKDLRSQFIIQAVQSFCFRLRNV